MKSSHTLLMLGLPTIAAAILLGHGPQRAAVLLADDAGKITSPRPVEDDMHEFMEYVFQPTYGRLKATMASEPMDNQGWKAIKADSLILAEGGNLLLFRGPEDQRDDWTGHAADVRDLGGSFYRAAQQKDFAAARKSYQSMLNSCNACHQQFADGEHQLKP